MISVLTPKCGNKVVSSIIKGDRTTYYKMSEHVNERCDAYVFSIAYAWPQWT